MRAETLEFEITRTNDSARAGHIAGEIIPVQEGFQRTPDDSMSVHNCNSATTNALGDGAGVPQRAGLLVPDQSDHAVQEALKAWSMDEDAWLSSRHAEIKGKNPPPSLRLLDWSSSWK
jgi:hypothetical protein